ncbi:MAG: helix-turn-helix domain-containing protein [Prevotellaceae bacterium]|nr:helix-turn-helix domain-containing protein [Prevotellaceae bacterium]
MPKILNVKSVHDYNEYLGQKDSHQLVSVIDYAAVSPIRHSLNRYSVYGLFLRDDNNVELSYGCGQYKYGESTLLCVSPGQIGGKEDNGETCDIKGWALLFHPELIQGTFVEQKMKSYKYFSYNVNEALHLDKEARATIIECFKMIQNELNDSCREYKKEILVGIIDVVLQYCMRFYELQFRTLKHENNDILARFEKCLNAYYENERQLVEGLPTVQRCANDMCMSTNYFADTIKRLTGITASEYLRNFIIGLAKGRMIGGETVSQAAYNLGFEYPQHLSRMFKKTEGCTPSEFIARTTGGK